MVVHYHLTGREAFSWRRRHSVAGACGVPMMDSKSFCGRRGNLSVLHVSFVFLTFLWEDLF